MIFYVKGKIRKTQLKPLIVDVPAEEGGFDRIYRIGIVSDYFPFEPVTQSQSILIALRGAFESVYLDYGRIGKGVISHFIWQH